MAAALMVIGVSGARGATETPDLLVSTAWLAEHLKDPNLVLLHVGEQVAYDASHIPGARLVVPRDLAQPASEGSLSLEMLSADQLRTKLQALGISDDSTVVVYYAKDWISPATRVIFTLDYAGLDRVRLLDGGMEAWAKDGHPVTDQVSEARVGQLKPLTLRDSIVDADWVKSHVGTAGFAIVDARDPDFYRGVKTGGSPQRQHKTGHVAGAISVPFSTLVTEDLRIRNREELANAFARAGVKPSDTVVTYCHIGQQATASLFAARLLGHKVLLYDGSFEDWSRRDLPVETGGPPGSKADQQDRSAGPRSGDQVWSVEFLIRGDRFTGTMTASLAGDSVSGSMLIEAPMRIEAQVQGKQTRESLSLDFPYTVIGENCTGRVQIEAKFSADGQEATGTAHSVDCQNQASDGTVTLKKARPAGGPGA